MVINALNANVKVFMADFEDSLAREMEQSDSLGHGCAMRLTAPSARPYEAGKIYQLKPNPAVLICRYAVCTCRKNMSPGVVRHSQPV
ncbi:hypothetical protein ACLK1S_24975 [Escherichia coli]